MERLLGGGDVASGLRVGAECELAGRKDVDWATGKWGETGWPKRRKDVHGEPERTCKVQVGKGYGVLSHEGAGARRREKDLASRPCVGERRPAAGHAREEGKTCR